MLPPNEVDESMVDGHLLESIRVFVVMIDREFRPTPRLDVDPDGEEGKCLFPRVALFSCVVGVTRFPNHSVCESHRVLPTRDDLS